MSDSLRLFFAGELPESPGEELEALSLALSREAPGLGVPLRAVSRENLHVTIRFLGTLGGERVPELTAALERAARDVPPIPLGCGEVTTFGPPARARVVVVPLIDDTGWLGGVASRLDQELERLGFPPEARPFRPHVTVGRCQPRRRTATLLQRPWSSPAEPFTMSSLSLLSSTLSGAGARYEALSRIVLHGSASR